jgi:hypothetical protein
LIAAQCLPIITHFIANQSFLRNSTQSNPNVNSPPLKMIITKNTQNSSTNETDWIIKIGKRSTSVNYSNFCNQIKTIIGTEEFLYKTTTRNLKLTLNSPQSFCQIIKLLNENSIEYITYQAKEDKSYRIVLKNFHHVTPIDLITQELSWFLSQKRSQYKKQKSTQHSASINLHRP